MLRLHGLIAVKIHTPALGMETVEHGALVLGLRGELR
jgi:hypothetical protein